MHWLQACGRLLYQRSFKAGMSIVTLQLGQCGNQVGHAFFSSIIEDLASGDCRRATSGRAVTETDDAYSEVSRNRFFHCTEAGQQQAMRARAVLCDAEEKVVAMVTEDAAKSGCWAYANNAKVCLKRGSGNNWAQGYRHHGPKCWPNLSEIVRRQAEASDRLDGFLALMSLAGGTGSGLGTFVCEQVRDEYPEANLISGLVWPHSRGEVSVQAYNSVLTTAHLTAACDALLLFENDRLQDACERRLGLARVDVGHLNAMIGHQLGAILQPACGVQSAAAQGPALGGIAASLCPHPDLRLLQLRCLPYASERAKEFSGFAWPGLLRHLRQMLLAGAAVEEGLDWRQDAALTAASGRQRCFASRLWLRGLGAGSLCPADWEQHLLLPELHPAWLPQSDRLTVCRTGRPYRGYERACALVSNCATGADTLDRSIARAWSMFAAKAFVHQYARFGLEEAAFLDCFAAAEQTVFNYRNL
ncbi:hypothetical protein BOX15_Mlig030247g1 [Macrostomum lignano]|uniref:Tubulin delta chain n=3 Tax=Macrostomum lignano TaxID=282301 RepID=A0A267GKB6_9PLAT|nr:hypothetical protein BOX15_Mlig030247g1 [Macrostomum lignano]